MVVKYSGNEYHLYILSLHLTILLCNTGNGHDWRLKMCCSQEQVEVQTTLNIYHRIVLDHSIAEGKKFPLNQKCVRQTMYPDSNILTFNKFCKKKKLSHKIDLNQNDLSTA